MSFRSVRGIVASVALGPVLAASLPALPALGSTMSGGWRGAGLTSLQMLGLFVVGPILAFLGLAFLFVLLPEWATGSRQRPDLSWASEPVWFEGPGDGQHAVEVAEPSQNGGGASARW